jgi:ATPase family associated with various cellular activities (AAA)
MPEQESSLAQAAKQPKVNWDKLDPKIEYQGRAITLPGDPAKMPISEAVRALQRIEKDENTIVRVFELIDAYPLDAAVAFVRAMTKLYGWSSPVATPGFFGPTPPTMISVKVGVNDDDVIQCPLGSFVLPGVAEKVGTTFTGHPKGLGQVFVIHGEFKKKDKHLILELANEARRIVKEQSIYKGKAIRLGVNDEGVLDMHNPPDFMDVSEIREEDLIFNDNTTHQIDTNILVPMKYTERCRKHKIPIKRGVLLEGPYGTGKSLTARMAAKVAQDNGWTFILLDNVKGLRVALEFANRYAPAVVFAEDIDRIASERDNATNDLINVIDGVVSKRSEIMTILTTNFAENLNPVILRPGRLDAVISLRAPDADTVKKLIRFYAGSLLQKDADLSGSAKELAGQIPASIRECVERAKLGMIGRNDVTLSDLDIMISAQTMKNHLALLNRDDKEKSEPEKLAESLKNVIGNGSSKILENIQAKVTDVHESVC